MPPSDILYSLFCRRRLHDSEATTITLADYKRILSETFQANRHLRFQRIDLISLFEGGGKYVGCAILPSGVVVCANNSATRCLVYDPKTNTTETFGNLSNLSFSYTGVATYEGKAYCFPRNSNALLEIDAENKAVREIPLDIDYVSNGGSHSHHYGGTVVGDMMYCAPRTARHILAILLKDFSVRKIGEGFLEKNMYCGTVLHPNGTIYFLPQTKSCVLAFNPGLEQFEYIGKPLHGNFFGGVTYSDGNIYSIGRNGGILKIDIEAKTTEIVQTHTNHNVPINGIYGTKLSCNGWLFGIMGDARCGFAYHPSKNEAHTFGHFDDGRYNTAKWAGGALLEDGSIFLVPAFGRFAAKYVFSQPAVMSDEMKGLLRSQYLNGY